MFPATAGASHPSAAPAVPIFWGIFDSNMSGKNRTRSQKCGQWKPPMSILDLASLPNRLLSLFLYTTVNLESRMYFGCRLRLRGKLAVVLDIPGSHKVLTWTSAS